MCVQVAATTPFAQTLQPEDFGTGMRAARPQKLLGPGYSYRGCTEALQRPDLICEGSEGTQLVWVVLVDTGLVGAGQ